MKVKNRAIGSVCELVAHGAGKYITEFAVESEDGSEIATYSTTEELLEYWETYKPTEKKTRRYRLLKDLPTFKAGGIFHISPKGSLVSDNEFSKGIVAYARSTLAKFPSILTDWFEEIWPQQLRIVNENMRKCVELWAKLNGYDLLQYNEGDDWCCFYENAENDEIIFSNRRCSNLKDGEFYSTAELCGEEEE